MAQISSFSLVKLQKVSDIQHAKISRLSAAKDKSVQQHNTLANGMDYNT